MPLPGLTSRRSICIFSAVILSGLRGIVCGFYWPSTGLFVENWFSEGLEIFDMLKLQPRTTIEYYLSTTKIQID